MRAIKIDSEPMFYQSYNFELFSMGNHEFIRYGKDLSDSASVSFLFVSGKNDSVSIFAHSTSFARADSANGVSGAWKHVDGDMSINWNIGPDTINYSQTVLDFDSGQLITVEEHHGTYTLGISMVDPGWHYLEFEDGKKAVVLPIVFKDILYMFDLNMSRAQFSLTEKAPTYDDYKKARSQSSF